MFTKSFWGKDIKLKIFQSFSNLSKNFSVFIKTFLTESSKLHFTRPQKYNEGKFIIKTFLLLPYFSVVHEKVWPSGNFFQNVCQNCSVSVNGNPWTNKFSSDEFFLWLFCTFSKTVPTFCWKFRGGVFRTAF